MMDKEATESLFVSLFFFLSLACVYVCVICKVFEERIDRYLTKHSMK